MLVQSYEEGIGFERNFSPLVGQVPDLPDPDQSPNPHQYFQHFGLCLAFSSCLALFPFHHFSSLLCTLSVCPPAHPTLHSGKLKMSSPKNITMNFGVIVFPGSNCDHDAWYAIQHNLGQSARFIWHDSHQLGDVDAVILPGGFSFGDYLRCGAIAKFSPVMAAVRKFAAAGGPVIGMCNGFQILVECGLLPGALLRNAGLKFLCQEVKLRTETTDSLFTSQCAKGQILRLPIAHGEGCYYADRRTLDELAAEDRIAFRYVDNPNGSLDNIAGVLNRERNVLGLMPHPERASDELMGSTDGLTIFRSMVGALMAARL
jgi:phosphoribosylformylglycinamidine synthase I